MLLLHEEIHVILSFESWQRTFVANNFIMFMQLDMPWSQCTEWAPFSSKC